MSFDVWIAQAYRGCCHPAAAIRRRATVWWPKPLSGHLVTGTQATVECQSPQGETHLIDQMDSMSKRKLTAQEKAAKRRRRKEFMTIFVNGKQKRVRRPQPMMVEGLDADELILRNPDPIWLHQSEMWELIDPADYTQTVTPVDDDGQVPADDDGIPF
jgi:hypothetical protein